MAYAPIAKLDHFTGKEDDAQAWINDVTKAIIANNWDDTKTMQVIPYFLKDMANFWYHKFLRYFSNNNSINHLASTFTTIKQGDTEAVTTYLGCFHINLCQIQAIQDDYFTVPQILNQFIRGLCSNLLQRVCPMHPVDFPTTVTHTKDFKAAELKANYAQAQHLISCDSQKRVFTTIVQQSKIRKPILKPQSQISDSESLPKSKPISNHLSAHNAAANLSTTSILTSNLSATATNNLSTTTTSHLSTTATPDLKSHKTGDRLLVTPKDAISNTSETNQQVTLFSNIPSATVTNNEFLAAIFSFELEEPFQLPLFSGATLKKKPITVMYTDMKVDRHSIKLILDSSSAGSIITKQLMNQLGRQVDRTASTRIITADSAMKTPMGEIDNFPIEINGIVTSIKVLVMETTQYQTLVGNNWLVKINTVLNWTMQKLQLSQNGQHT
ncbi:hypothetical protein G9A89_000652 [Geosiphon pyriformis]|nr:hypothetical protein G9A89_000652 [Geosiphon pyriformis]